MRRSVLVALVFIALGCLLALAVYRLPCVHERLSWRLAGWRSQVYYALNPPGQAVFAPGEQAQAVQVTLPALASATLQAVPPAQTIATSALAAPPTPRPSPTPLPAPAPTALPARVVLSGIRHQWQTFNNCGPANLAMALSYWGWQGDQQDTRAYLRPGKDDFNVMPAELVAFVQTQTGLRAAQRAGGDLALLRRLVAAGYPVIIESGHDPPDDWWMGHYVVVSGYDDLSERLITQDSLIQPDLPVPYPEIEQHGWRDFNNLLIVIYPPEQEQEVLDLLGPYADPDESWRLALQKAQEEAPSLSGRDLYFAWFNQGSSLAALQQYVAAAEAYDVAFALYAGIPEEERPWRMLWYQTGPYEAYYYSGRYNDVIRLAGQTLSWLSKRGLEESHYWRGLAYEAQGNPAAALADLRIAVELNPAFDPAQAALERLASIDSPPNDE